MKAMNIGMAAVMALVGSFAIYGQKRVRTPAPKKSI